MSYLKSLKTLLSDEKVYGKGDFDIHLEPTGISLMDYVNGTYDEKGNIHVGMPNGRVMMFLGKSQSGKSTMAYQVAHGMTKGYENGNVILFEFEVGSSENRIKAVTGISEEEFREKWEIKNLGIYTETVRTTIRSIHDVKMKEFDNIAVTDPITGKKVLPPTVIIVDSVPTMQPRDMVDNDTQSQTNAMTTARANLGLLRMALQPCMEANITLIFINHMYYKINTNPHMPEQSDYIYGGNKNSVPGGSGFKYIPTYIALFHPVDKLSDDKTLGVRGLMTKMTVIKSRTALPNNSVNLVLDQVNGFDEVLSNFEYIRGLGRVKGGGSSYYLDTLPDVKFRLGTFKDKYNSEPKLKAAFDEVLAEELKKLVSIPSKVNFAEPVLEDAAKAEEEFDQVLGAALNALSDDGPIETDDSES